MDSGEHVAESIQSDVDTRMAQPPTHDLGMYACLKHKRWVCVAQVVESCTLLGPASFGMRLKADVTFEGSKGLPSA